MYFKNIYHCSLKSRKIHNCIGPNFPYKCREQNFAKKIGFDRLGDAQVSWKTN